MRKKIEAEREGITLIFRSTELPPTITVKKAAEITGMSTSLLYRLIQEGAIPTTKSSEEQNRGTTLINVGRWKQRLANA